MSFKDLGVQPFLFPMPVLMIATYGENGTVDVMNMAWGGICAENMIACNLAPERKTVANIKARKAFTVSVADAAHLDAADYFGIESGNDVADKFARTGLTAVKSERVDAPVVEEFPITCECELECIQEQFGEVRVVGRIVNVLAREDVLDEGGNVDASKLGGVIFNQMDAGYYAVGEKVGEAWGSGKKFMA